MKIGNQDKSWALHSCCSSCNERLTTWTNGKLKSMPFGIPMMWLEPKNHTDDCYFCTLNLAGFNRHKKKSWSYPNVESARRPVPHSEEIPVPVYNDLPLASTDESEISATENSQYSIHSNALSETGDSAPQLFTNIDSNNFIRDLGL